MLHDILQAPETPAERIGSFLRLLESESCPTETLVRVCDALAALCAHLDDDESGCSAERSGLLLEGFIARGGVQALFHIMKNNPSALDVGKMAATASPILNSAAERVATLRGDNAARVGLCTAALRALLQIASACADNTEVWLRKVCLLGK